MSKDCYFYLADISKKTWEPKHFDVITNQLKTPELMITPSMHWWIPREVYIFPFAGTKIWVFEWLGKKYDSRNFEEKGKRGKKEGKKGKREEKHGKWWWKNMIWEKTKI